MSHSREFSFPTVPVIDTEVIMVSMSKGKWELPMTPYTFLDKFEKNDDEFWRKHKLESFHSFCRDVVKSWIPFLDGAEKGCKIIKEVYEKGLLKYDLPSIERYNSFFQAFKPKFEEKGKEITDKEIIEVIHSCKKPFLFLLTKEQLKELNHRKPSKISQEDIENVKYLVERIKRFV